MTQSTPTASPRPVLIDCDTGIDDAVALVYLAAAHHAGKIELAGVTCTAGNTSAEQAANNTRYILDLCGLGDVPVAHGLLKPREVELTTTPETHGPSGLGYARAPLYTAHQPWYHIWDRVLERENPHLIITGPVTTAAAWPGDLSDTQITWMGGAFLHAGNTTPTAEWNAWVDSHAAKDFFARTDINPVTVCSLGVTEKLRMDDGFAEDLAANLARYNTELADVLTKALSFYLDFHEKQGEGRAAKIHDALACMIALDAVPFEATDAIVDVEAHSALLRGTTVADTSGRWDRNPNARVVTDVDVPAARKELLVATRSFSQRR